RSGITRLWLHDDLFGRDSRQLALNGLAHEFVGDDPEGLIFSQRQQPLHGLLNHGLLAVQREHLFRQPAPAARPKTGAAASSQNHGIERMFAHSSVISPWQGRSPSSRSLGVPPAPPAETNKETPLPIAASA